MAKRPQKLIVRVPNFNKDSKEWRRGINRAVANEQQKHSIRYDADDKLDVRVQFYLQNPKLTILDLDNRLKDVFDALQGFIGEKGKRGTLMKIIPNDNQIYRMTAEKRIAPKANRETESIIEIRRYSAHAGTARYPRSSKKAGKDSQI
jgi:Holliday junction resolvase RusA-like endonuclease